MAAEAGAGPVRGGSRRWLRTLPRPVAVTYEAGPTGFGLARHLRNAGFRCLVAAPSKLSRPGVIGQTDAGDAELLAWVLKLDEIVEVVVPPVEQAPPAARARGHDGNRRLHQRWQTFTARRKKPVIANIAIARELAGWAWSLAVLE